MLFSNPGIFTKMLFVEITVLLIIVMIFRNMTNEKMISMIESFIFRFNGINNVFSDRGDQYTLIMKSWENYFFGHGLGSGGHEAVRLGYIGINDGNYHKILYETGIIGCLWFAIIIVATFIRGLWRFKYCLLELTIVFYYIVAMLGQNVLEFRIMIIPFWYCLGKIWNKKLLGYGVYE
jgi:hypothetical protein